ncbi:MAG: hypothetical protein ACW960_05645 [Candidatus Thorarchaeota archaeon]|jgi:hypothetical protein
MQEQMFVIPIPPLLALGFLIGIILLVLGYREESDLTRRHHLMGSGVVVIGIMIPITPLSWYGYWMVTRGLVLGLTEIVIIAIALIVGILLVYKGVKTYSGPQ